ncbi:MAG TPA: glycosyltransferase family 2 protein [Rhizomicrobium sp.]|nr:glycosyltransferase family 2 protein [Rhizomicrobium sp.]
MSPRVTEVAFAKNEGRFFLEWIAYHRAIGVSDFLIYTNDCEDESPALLDRLEAMGVVAHVPNPIGEGEQPQNKALDRALEHPLVTGADYVLQIDPDEFLVVKAGGGRIADLIATAPEADVISVQMRFFGDSGLASLPDGLAIESLIRASTEDFEVNRIVKSLARVGGPFSKITANHMPMFEPENGQHPRLFNAGGREIPPEAYHGVRFSKMPDEYRSMEYAQLNHYAVRTFADYRAKKYRGTAANNDKKLTMAYWRQRNRNDVVDTQALRHREETKRLMAEWLADPELARLNRRCFEAYAAILEKARGLLAEGAR